MVSVRNIMCTLETEFAIAFGTVQLPGGGGIPGPMGPCGMVGGIPGKGALGGTPAEKTKYDVHVFYSQFFHDIRPFVSPQISDDACLGFYNNGRFVLPFVTCA